jgi:hypothetical protein
MKRHARMGPKRGRLCVLHTCPAAQSLSVAQGTHPQVPTAPGEEGDRRTKTMVAPMSSRTAKVAASALGLTRLRSIGLALGSGV